MIIIFVNCRLFPFIDMIIQGLKLYETRNRNTLKQFTGKTVYLAETGKGEKPLVRCSCIISELVTVTDPETYEMFRPWTRVEKGSIYDYTSATKKKCLYRLENVKPVVPFVPEGIRHGYTWMEVKTGL